MRALLLLLTAVLLGSCQVSSADHRESLTLEVPGAWSAPQGDGALPPPAWWQAFGSEELDALVREAIENNHDLAAAAARLRVAEAQSRIAGASRLPTVDLGANAARNKLIFVGLPVPGGDVLDSLISSYGVSLDVSWEADLWGRLAAERGAAAGELLAAAEERRAAELSLAGQTVKTWLAWHSARLQETLSERSLDTRQRSFEVVRQRFDTGRGSSLDLRRAGADLASAEAQLEVLREATVRVERQLEILLGRHPSGEVEGTPQLPELPDPPPAGLPSELLRRRPDLAAAEARLIATDRRLDAARAERYPRLSLTASGGRTSTELGDLLDASFTTWSLIANLAQPIFAGGRIKAGIDAAEARAIEAAEVYAGTVLRAFAEVETALALEGSYGLRESAQTRARDEAASALELARERYAAGRSDLTTLLDSQRQALDAESRLIDVERERLETRVDLYLALGGAFPNEEAAPEESPEDSAQ